MIDMAQRYARSPNGQAADRMIIRALSIALLLGFMHTGRAEAVRENELLPHPLPVGDGFTDVVLKQDDGSLAGIGMPVSIVAIDDHRLVVATYSKAWVIEPSTGLTKEIRKPTGVSGWVPTGLAFDTKARQLFVANYLANDVLVLMERTTGDWALVDRYVDPDMVGPENVALSPDGAYLAVADFSNSSVIFFDRASHAKLWRNPLRSAHGVVFGADGKDVYASGLQPATVVRYGIDGEIKSRVSAEGWAKDQYLWPTSLAVDGNADIWITDAHLGRIRRLTPELHEMETIGGNGLGVRLFNMPYGIFFDNKNRLWVADAFKSRIVWMNNELELVGIRRSAIPPEGWWPRQLTDDPTATMTGPASPTRNATASNEGSSATLVQGDGYEHRVKTDVKMTYDFGAWGDRIWNPGYNRIAADDGSTLSLAGAFPFFTSGMYYWVQMALTNAAGKQLAILGSPQDREWLVLDGGLPCPITLDLDFWLHGDALMPTYGRAVSVVDMVATCTERFDAFRGSIRQGADPLVAFATHVLRQAPEPLIRQLDGTFQSDTGKTFWEQAKGVTSVRDRAAQAKHFLEKIQQEKLVFLPEVWVASILLSALN